MASQMIFTQDTSRLEHIVSKVLILKHHIQSAFIQVIAQWKRETPKSSNTELWS